MCTRYSHKFYCFLFFVLFGSSTYLPAQDCYEILHAESGTRDLLYDDRLTATACALQATLDSNGFDGFRVIGQDYYPLLAYVAPYDYYAEIHRKAMEELGSSPSGLIVIAKEHQRDGRLNYRVEIELPASGAFTTLTPFEREAIAAEVRAAVAAEAERDDYSLSANPDVEMAGLDRLRNICQQVFAGTLELASPYQKAGFESVAVFPGEAVQRGGAGTYVGPGDKSGDYLYDYTGLVSNGENGTPALIRNALSSADDPASPDPVHALFSQAHIITDDQNTTAELDQAAAAFAAAEQKLVVWMHFAASVQGEEIDSVYIKTTNNLTDAEAEYIVDFYFEQTLRSRLPELYEAVAALRQDPDISLLKTLVDCSLNWEWGKQCLLPELEGATSPFWQENQFNGGLAIGLLDGILATVQFLYEAGKNAKEVGENGWRRATGYLYELKNLYLKTESLRAVFSKVQDDSYDSLVAAWDELTSLYRLLKQTVSIVQDNYRRILQGIWEGVQDWMGALLDREARPGYDVGVLLFEVLVTYFSGGTKSGAKLIPKLTKWLKEIQDAPRETIKDLFFHVDGDRGKTKEVAIAIDRCKILGSGCFVADTPVLLSSTANLSGCRITAKAFTVAAALPIVAVPIQDVQLLDFAVAHQTVNSTYALTAGTDEDVYLGGTDKDQYTSDQQRERDKYELNNTDWNEVVFAEVNGSSTAKLALHQDWITQKSYRVDAVVNMNLPEQGISGPFRITSIKHILPQKRPAEEAAGTGFGFQPVTGIFIHRSNKVWTLTFDSGDTLGVTANHPIYSTTAGNWRLAGELEIGEQVLTHAGSATLVSKRPAPPQVVYNLEVRTDHNFLVTGVGVVVHNSGLCSFIKALFAKYSKWHKIEPDNVLNRNAIDNYKDMMRNNDPFIFNAPIYTTTHDGITYIFDGHHRLKAAKELKNEGFDIELQVHDINPANLNKASGGRFTDINDLINQSVGPNG